MPDAPEDVRKYRAPALEKGLDVLEFLAGRREPASLSQISVALGRSVSELFRMVQVLEFRGYLAPSPGGDGFVLTNRLFALGMTRPPAKDLLEAALPHMRAFAEAAGQSCHLAVASGAQMVVVARIEAPGDQGFSVRVGYQRPLALATSGVALYAFQPDDVRAQWRQALRPAAGAKVWEAFEAKAQAAREAGHVRAQSDRVPGVTDLSVPVRSGDRVVAAFSCPFLLSPTAIALEPTIARLAAEAAAVSTELTGA